MTPATAIQSGHEFDDLRHAVLRAVAPAVRSAGLEDHEIGCVISGDLGWLRVQLTGPSCAGCVRQAIGVRVLDAIREDGRTFGAVDVDCRFGS